jgi:hypothetical protein
MIDPAASMMPVVDTLAHSPSIIYFTIVKYSGIVQAHCAWAVTRYCACYCKTSAETAAEQAETN